MYQLVFFIEQLIGFYELLIVVWCIFSWIPLRRDGFVYDVAMAINRLVDPYVALFRRFIPPIGNVDCSPIVAMIALQLLERLLVAILL